MPGFLYSLFTFVYHGRERKMKRHFCYVIISVIVLVLLSAAFAYAAESNAAHVLPAAEDKSAEAAPAAEETQPVTREEFFAYIAKWLGLEPLGSCPKSFPDLNRLSEEYKGLVFAMIGREYVIGTTEGTLEPDRILSLEEMGWVFDRIIQVGAVPIWAEKEPQVVTKTVYLDGGTEYVTQYTDRHAYEYDKENGYFWCRHCNQIMPPGTAVYEGASDVPGTDITGAGDLPYTCPAASFNDFFGTINPVDTSDANLGEEAYLAYNANIFIDDGSGSYTKQTDLLKFYEDYVYTDPGPHSFYYDLSASLSFDGKPIVTVLLIDAI